LLDEKGNAHLTDFNIAVHFGERKLTGVAGSMAYMAPEYVTRAMCGIGTDPDLEY